MNFNFNIFKYVLIVWALCILTFYAIYLYRAHNSSVYKLNIDGIDLGEVIEELNQNFLQPSKVSGSLLRSFVNQKMTSPESRLDYLQDYFVDAKLDEQELSEINSLLEGVQLEGLDKYEVKVRDHVENKIQNPEKQKAFLRQLDVFKANIGDLDRALEEFAQQLNTQNGKIEL